MLKSILFLILSLFFTLPAISQTPTEEKGWTNWVYLGSNFYSDPAACTAGDLTFVFGRRTDSEIWYKKRYLPTGQWGPWKKFLPAYSGNQRVWVSGSPAAFCSKGSSYESIRVTFVGTDNRVWSVYGSANATYDAFNYPIQTVGFNAAHYSGLAMAGTSGVLLHQIVKGADNRMYIKSNNDLFFKTLISEPTYNDPAATMASPDRLDFFYRDSGGRLWQQFMVANQWYPRQLIPGVTYSSPEVISRDITSMDLFARGYNNTLIHKRSINQIWGPWVNLGGSVASAPGATTYANNQRIFVFARWTDGTIRYKAWAP